MKMKEKKGKSPFGKLNSSNSKSSNKKMSSQNKSPKSTSPTEAPGSPTSPTKASVATVMLTNTNGTNGIPGASSLPSSPILTDRRTDGPPRINSPGSPTSPKIHVISKDPHIYAHAQLQDRIHPAPVSGVGDNGVLDGVADGTLTPADLHDDRPSSAMSATTAPPQSPTESVASTVPPVRLKMTVGEIVQQIESKSASLLQKQDFTHEETLADLHFLAQQSRYNSDMQVKRKLVSKMVENGVLEIFLRVYKSVHSVDYLRLLGLKPTQNHLEVENNENHPVESTSNSFTDLSSHPDAKDDGSTKDYGKADPETQSIGGASIGGASVSGMDDRRPPRVDKSRNVPDCFKNFRSSITMLTNITEKSPSLCEDCIKRGIVHLLLKDLTDSRLGVSELKDPNKMYVVRGYLAILGNIIRFHSEARDIFRDAGAVKVLQQFLKSNLLLIKTRTIMLLSYLVNESENDIINASDKGLSLLVKVLNSAVEAENHYSRKYSYWAVEILAGLNRLAGFESNKERILHRGALPLYGRLVAVGCTEEEQLLAAQGLWILAFNKDSRKCIREEPGLIQALEALIQSSQREEIKRTAKGALWVIQERGKTWSHTANRDGGAASAVTHVMLSYQWSSKSVVFRLRDRLKVAGYKVWMDGDHMGATLESMAEAVDRAAVVLMCVSQKYKESPSCRTEAEFILHQKKDIIPLRVQPRYNADGWLGGITSSRVTSFDFTRDDAMEVLLANLIRELGNRGRIRPLEPMMSIVDGGSRSTLMSSQTSLITAIPDASYRIMNWSIDDVQRWLQDNGLASIKQQLGEVNGELLVEIRKMQQTAPDSFYACIRNELGLNFVDVLKFTKAMDKIFFSA